MRITRTGGVRVAAYSMSDSKGKAPPTGVFYMFELRDVWRRCRRWRWRLSRTLAWLC